MSKLKFFWLVVFGMLIPGLLLAQKGTIAGKVVDARTGDALPGANVVVQGLNIGSATNLEGEFTILNVGVGQRSILVRFIGYKSLVKVVDVTAGEVSELNFDMDETVLALNEIVVTGVGVATEKIRLGNTVATINIKAIENAPVQSLSEILQGRTAGVNVSPSGGLVGEGATIRIRGSASLSATNEPLIYIDGVRVNNGGGFALGGNGAGGGGGPSRLDDINPESIERIEILKGAAAATLYGTQASNGVIQIFTKQGQFSKPKFTVEIEAATIKYPDAFHVNTGFARNDEQAKSMSDAFGFTVRPFELVGRTNVNDILGTGLAQTYSLSVSGGGSGVTYFASGRFQHTNGPVDPPASAFLGLPPGEADDKLQRGQFSGTINIVPSNKLRIRLSTFYSQISQHTLQNNNNIFATVTLAMFGKPEFASTTNPQGTVAFATVRESTYRTVEDNVQHAGLAIGTSYKVTNEVNVEGIFGVDYTSQRSEEFTPFGWNVDNFTSSDVTGALQQGKRENKVYTLDVKGNWNHNFTDDISSTAVVGFQGFQSTLQLSLADVDVFPGAGLGVLDAGANQSVESVFTEVIEAGAYFQEQVGYKDYLYVTGGIRFDANSAFGSNFSTQSYPKLSASFIPTAAFDMSGMGISTLRLRAAWGKSGQQPTFFDEFTTFSPLTSTLGAGVAPENLGDPDLKPEVSSEIEVGFEIGILNDRLGLEFTYWDRVVNDALVYQQFPPSGGFRNRQLTNIGQIDAKGLDFTLNYRPVQSENFSLDLFANAAYLDEVVTSLGGAADQKISGTYSRIRNYLREGFAPGALFGAVLVDDPFPIDINGDGVADDRATLLTYFSQPRNPSDYAAVLKPGPDAFNGDPLAHYLGKPTPDWQGAFGLNIGFMKHFRLSSLFEYKAGDFTITNLTDAFRKSHPSIGRNTPEAAATELVLLNPASTAEERLDAAVKWENTFRALAPYSGLNTMESGNFLAIREIGLTYDFPRSLASRLGVDHASFTISGRNLHTFTGYSGTDPETNWLSRNGDGASEISGDPSQTQLDNNFLVSVDAFGLPIPRQILFKLRLGF